MASDHGEVAGEDRNPVRDRERRLFEILAAYLRGSSRPAGPPTARSGWPAIPTGPTTSPVPGRSGPVAQAHRAVGGEREGARRRPGVRR